METISILKDSSTEKGSMAAPYLHQFSIIRDSNETQFDKIHRPQEQMD
jgi:hypothetical protein